MKWITAVIIRETRHERASVALEMDIKRYIHTTNEIVINVVNCRIRFSSLFACGQVRSYCPANSVLKDFDLLQ